jgi:hypothetical protein
MRSAVRGVGIICFLAWACMSAQPCVAQAPGQIAPIEVPVAQGPDRVAPGTRAWGPEQATGAPDTQRAGDIPTAWASLDPDDGVEWLRVDFEEAVTVFEVNIRESFNPGAVSKVAAILEDGKEHVLWEGADPTTDAPADFTIWATDDVVTKSVKIYLDTSRKRGWNEIDAVELVGQDGTRQWASRASASSTYAERTAEPVPRRLMPAAPDGTRQRPLVVHMERGTSDPFADIAQKRVIVHLEGGTSIGGTFMRAAGGFIVLEQADPAKAMIVNVQKIIYLETAG